MANERLAAICIDLFSHFCNDQRQKKQALARSLAGDDCLADCTINRGCQKKPRLACMPIAAAARRFCDWRAGVKSVFIPFADSNVVCSSKSKPSKPTDQQQQPIDCVTILVMRGRNTKIDHRLM